jgi:peptide deformylase
MPKKLKILTVKNKKEEKFLRTKSQDVKKNKITTPSFQNFLDNLKHTAKNHVMDEGWMTAGLAAVQVGELEKVFVVLNSETNEFEEYINPEIEYLGNIQEKEVEGSLSLPEKQAEIPRFRKIKVVYKNRQGEKKVQKLDNYTSKVIQHEYDHLQGILFLDKLVE